jgi:hypothetical protein
VTRLVQQAKSGMRWRYLNIRGKNGSNVETLTISDVNLADLAWARAEGTVRNLADRRFDLYRIEWEQAGSGSEPSDTPHGPPPMHQHGPGGG